VRRSAAVLPLAIALAGGFLPREHGGLTSHVRLAPTASGTAAAFLNDTQEGWLTEHNPFGLPQTKNAAHHTLVVREGYTLAHNDVDLISDWVSYHLTRAEASGTLPRANAFKADPDLPKGHRAELGDYQGWGTVYDRGHQFPDADAKGQGKLVQAESYFLSNMTPQAKRLNEGAWKHLEEDVRAIAKSRGEIWVVTGPAYVDDDGDGFINYYVIGDDQVVVPTDYFKIVLAPKGQGDFEAMAILVRNEPLKDTMEDHLVSIDEIERVTGIDFFPDLPDSIETPLEKATATGLLQ